MRDIMVVLGRSNVRFILVFSVFTVLHWPTSAYAQPGCDTAQLPREASGENRLAVRLPEGWRYFTTNDEESAHLIQNGGRQELCLAWEAPPYPQSNRQVVYASTRYREDQPLWLFRNGSIARVPFFGRLLGDWSRVPDSSGVDVDDGFRVFHQERAGDDSSTMWNNLATWHDTSIWFSNSSSYELVSAATAGLELLPYGTERLLVLAARRPLTSWVAFTSYAPSSGERLDVAVSYSGDLDRLGPRVYRYAFNLE